MRHCSMTTMTTMSFQISFYVRQRTVRLYVCASAGRNIMDVADERS